MAGQGKTIKQVAAALTQNGWVVHFVCIPNTPHLTAVPISTPHCTTKQRYPDVVSSKGNWLKLTEVEVELNDQVASKTVERFSEMRSALSSVDYYRAWSGRVSELTGKPPPQNPDILCELVLCNEPDNSRMESIIATVRADNIAVVSAHKYAC